MSQTKATRPTAISSSARNQGNAWQGIGIGTGRGQSAALDRAWHAIHFALNGTRLSGQPPLNFLVDEGRPVGSVEVGVRRAH
ncbi:MAG: hypothetical protein NVSMB2_05920 [Chloroflexota bacterium]